ncbi:lipocalin-like domain-containing protein [Halopseudomonas salina]|uniref:Iron ABC transporter permease n=1 Tax=Halopseudomonas salina TaxID=1323744 RepID=A0ABQ1P585_9GAMM|nr:lipocalin-like domain-containing protein [Halopseudomonas salina]GGC91296.1 iron ABC transporter permease [Halopseudomonas salina]
MVPKWLCALILSSLAACDSSPPTAPAGFAGLGSEAEGFSAVTPGEPLRFPADFAAHPDYRIEWWYVTANLTDEQGKAWGAQWTLFRQAMAPQNEQEAQDGWQSAQVWLGHAGLTHADGHQHADRLARGGIGQAGVRVEPFQAWIDDWSLEGDADGQLSPLQVSAASEGFKYQLSLQAEGPLVLHGERGFSRKSDRGQASWYYSQPFYQVEGEIEWQGEQHKVSGSAWLDREWSSQPLAEDQQGWDWFSLHLHDGNKLMLFRLRSDDGSHFYSGTWITPNGVSEPLDQELITMTPLAQTEVAGRTLPTHWRLQVTGKGLDIEVQALNEQAWMGTGIPYWEGPIKVTGSHTGVGYLEMTGY